MSVISYDVPINAQRMTIGVQGENNVREFLFDVTEWRQITGNIGAAEMVVQRAGDSSPYAAAITMHDENTVSWIPKSADTAKTGVGKIQLMWIASGQTVKTKIFDMKVDPSLDYAVPDDSLDPWASWMPNLLNADARITSVESGLQDVRERQTSPYNFKGSVAGLDSLPSSGNEVNDTYYVEAVKYRVTWTGEDWQQSSLDESDYEGELADLKNDMIWESSEGCTHRLFINNGGVSLGYIDTNIDSAGSWTRSLYYKFDSSVFRQSGRYIDVKSIDKYAQLVEFDENKNFIRKIGEYNSVGFPSEATHSVTAYIQKGHILALNLGTWTSGEGSSYMTKSYLESNLFVNVTDMSFDLLNETTNNLIDNDYINYYDNGGGIYAVSSNLSLSSPLLPGTYTIYVYGKTTSSNITVKLFSSYNYSNSSLLLSFNLSKTGGVATFTLEDTANNLTVMSADSSPYEHFNVSLYGGENTPWSSPNHVSAVDKFSRLLLPLQSTQDETDRTSEIIYRLELLKYCELGTGVFYASRIKMPEGTMIKGQGFDTKLIFIEDSVGECINLGDMCEVCNLSLYGGDISDVGANATRYDAMISIGNWKDEFIGTIQENTAGINEWSNGNLDTTENGAAHIVLDNPIPAGAYKISLDTELSSTEGSYLPHIYFSTSTTTSIGPSSIIEEVDFTKNTRSTRTILLRETVYSVRVTSNGRADQSESSGISCIFSNIKLTKVGGRIGIMADTPGNKLMKLSNVDVFGFSCAGVLGQDTGLGPDNGIMISNCNIMHNTVGIFLRRLTEFCVISDCNILQNWIGFYSRSGNNLVSNCNISSNGHGMLHDMDEGSNTGHGHVDGCTFAHNAGENYDSNYGGFGIRVKDTGRMAFNGCYLGYNSIELENTNSNIFTGCQLLSKTPINISYGGFNLFNGCVFINLGSDGVPITIENNDKVKFLSTFTRGGDIVDPYA